MRILVVSNGYGEDLIACNLIQAIQEKAPKSEILVIPLVGTGGAYQKLGISPCLTQSILPSGGFIRNIFVLFKDIYHGLLKNIFKQFLSIRKIGKTVDFTLCVGDVFCLLMGSFGRCSTIYFLPTAKSHLFMSHSKIEKIIMKRVSQLVFPRDVVTEKSLQAGGVPAHYFGNPMMDGFAWPDQLFSIQKSSAVIGLVPGSREEAYMNFQHMLKVVESVYRLNSGIVFLFAKAPSLSLADIRDHSLPAGWSIQKTSDYDEICAPFGAKIIVCENYAEVIGHSTLILGLAGTANEQASYFNVPVFSFEGFGPQSTLLRFQEQKQLLEGHLTILEDSAPDSIADHLNVFIQDQKNYRPATSISNRSSVLIVDAIFQHVLKDSSL